LILVSLGTHQQPFERALDLVQSLTVRDEEILIQHGSTTSRPDVPNTRWVKFMAFEDLVTAMRQAESIVCHAGVGTIMTAMQTGHTPVVIPRQARFGEHVDDHQVELATSFAGRGLVFCVTVEKDLCPLLRPREAGAGQRIGKGSKQLREAVLRAASSEPWQ
jgi:UDP-N-acetylglucosamine transferase subunit ALG13